MIYQLIFYLLLQIVTCLEAIVNVSPTTVNQVSDLELMISFDESIGKGGSISIIIPDPSNQINDVFSESPLNKPLQFNDASNLNCMSSDIQIQSCVTPSSNQLDINVDANQFILAGDTVQFTLQQGTKNPSSLWFLQQSYQIKTFNSGGQEIENKQQDINLVSLRPETISQSTITYGSNTFGIGSQTIEVSFTNVNAIPREGKIELVFPQRAATSGEHQYFLNSGNFSIQTFTVNGVNHQNSPQFQYSILDRFSLGQILTIQAPLTGSGDIAQGSQIYVKITEFNNPLSVSQSQGLQIKTYDNLLAQIDESGSISLVVQNPAQILSPIVKIDSASSKVSENSGLMFTFQSPFPLSAGCLIHLTVPVSMSNSLSDNIRYIYAYGMFGSMQSLPFLIQSNGVNQVVVVQDACKAFLSNDQEAKLKVKYFENPDSVRDSGIYKIEVFDSSSNLIAETSQSQSDFQIDASQLSGGQLQSGLISPSNTTVREQNDILISMTLKNGLEIARNPKVSISVPVGFQVQSSCQIESFSHHVRSSSDGASCQVLASERRILLSSITSSTSSNSHLNGELNFKIVGAINNHVTEEPLVGEFQIQTMVGNDELVDFIIISNPFVVDAGSLYESDVSFSPSINSEAQPDLVTSFKVQHGLVSGSLIHLSLPTQNQELQISSQIQSFGCSGSKIKTSSCSAIQSQDQYGLEIILIQAETQETIQSMSVVEISFSNIVEMVPRFQGTLSKPITIETSTSGQIVDKETNLIAQVDKVKAFTEIDLQLSSSVNLEDSSLLLDLTVSIDQLESNDYMLINIPEQIKLEQSSLECQPYNCIIIDDSDKLIKIDGISGQTISLEIKGVENSYSTKPVGPLVVSLYDSKDRLLQKNDSAASFLLSTSQAASTQKVRIIQSSTVPSEASNFTLTIEKNFQEHQLGGLPWVKLTLPECIQFSENKELEIFDESAVLEEEKFVTFTKYSQFDYVFRLHEGINFFTLMNLKNPNEQCLWSAQRLSFEYRTFEDEQLLYAMEQRIEGLEPSLSCKTPCATCGTVDKGFCHSCLDPQSNVLLQETGECVQGTQCPSGFYFSDSFNDKCKSCSQGCMECESYSGLCSKCESGYLLNQTSQLCILEAQCKREDGMIQMVDRTCQKCFSDCKECGALSTEVQQNAATQSPYYCTLCNDPVKFLHDGLCVDICPEGFLSQSFFQGKKGLRFLDDSASNQQKRICVSDGSANQSKLRELLTTGSALIQQSKPSALLAHFPILFLVLGPLIFVQYTCQVGRHSLSFREISILSLQGLEYLSLWILLVKVALAIVHQQRILQNILAFDSDNELDAMHSSEVQSDPVKKRLQGLFLLAFVTILAHHFMNEVFHRKLIQVWESVIEEDFTEEFRKNPRTRCCVEYTRLVRYFNYCEWIGMWKRSGSIIPPDAAILKDNIQYLFVMFSVRQICFVPRHFFWIVIMMTFKYEPLKSKYFTEQYLDGSLDLSATESQNFEDFEQYSSDIRDFIFNQMLEFVVLGLLANFLFLNWLKEGDVLKLSDEWENQEEIADGVEDSVHQNALDQTPKTIRMSEFRGDRNQTPIATSYQRQKNQLELNQLHKDDSLVDHNMTPGVRLSRSPDKEQKLQRSEASNRQPEKINHEIVEGLESIQEKGKVVEDEESNRSDLDNSMRPLNPEEKRETACFNITDPSWKQSRKEKKMAPPSIHKNSIQDVVSDKFTIGPNNGEAICHDEIELSISNKTGQHLSKLMIEEDPRLLLCTCAKQCGQINAFCDCQKVPNQLANLSVFQQLIDEQVEVYDYFHNQLQSLYETCEFSQEKIQQVKDASSQMLMKDFEFYNQEFLKLEMGQVWAQHCENLKKKLHEDIDSTVQIFEQPQSQDGMEFQKQSDQSKSQKDQGSSQRQNKVSQSSAMRLKSAHRRVATDASQVEIITEEDPETNYDPQDASSQFQDENLIESNRMKAEGMHSNRQHLDNAQSRFDNSRAPSTSQVDKDAQ